MSLGFRSPDVGVSIPSQSSPNHDQEYNAALLLGQQTQNVARTITGEFVLYELLVQIMINPHAYFHQQEILIHIIRLKRTMMLLQLNHLQLQQGALCQVLLVNYLTKAVAEQQLKQC
jgi:hypothetical protein